MLTYFLLRLKLFSFFKTSLNMLQYRTKIYFKTGKTWVFGKFLSMILSSTRFPFFFLSVDLFTHGNWQLLNKSTLVLKFDLELSHQTYQLVYQNFWNFLQFHRCLNMCCIRVSKGTSLGSNKPFQLICLFSSLFHQIWVEIKIKYIFCSVVYWFIYGVMWIITVLALEFLYFRWCIWCYL